MNHISEIMTVGVPVTDQDRAVAFYTETLGFEVLMDAPLPQFGGRWIVVAPAGSAGSIALVPAGEGNPAGVDTGIRMASPDAKAAHQHFLDAGVDTDELLEWPGVPPMFSLRDPDGNRLYISQA
ncbi:catechol 2,3-dioxygenase-like lactoylglutathione lyase family enzyme [Kribbella pratensis]|jgi:catechol 2,3-dioxygenase-like lactoylglutathione lyase family enzyme|uniref:Catechol 2,3-dioxygenase-like lactoylglutathione lyase family enzyme n=1 Tax=Kribbella pratensis TaxID=2512112 RepID=A0ABY2FLL6_9ACTN|nr:VOC family protein [Kribbella pratensis]TDW94026.1 catechol 2,3-dioxygenase-like lactoylglutathione lyase family enzyme [Kribbella pratensis]